MHPTNAPSPRPSPQWDSAECFQSWASAEAATAEAARAADEAVVVGPDHVVDAAGQAQLEPLQAVLVGDLGAQVEWIPGLEGRAVDRRDPGHLGWIVGAGDRRVEAASEQDQEDHGPQAIR